MKEMIFRASHHALLSGPKIGIFDVRAEDFDLNTSMSLVKVSSKNENPHLHGSTLLTNEQHHLNVLFENFSKTITLVTQCLPLWLMRRAA